MKLTHVYFTVPNSPTVNSSITALNFGEKFITWQNYILFNYFNHIQHKITLTLFQNRHIPWIKTTDFFHQKSGYTGAAAQISATLFSWYQSQDFQSMSRWVDFQPPGGVSDFVVDKHGWGKKMVKFVLIIGVMNIICTWFLTERMVVIGGIRL